MDNPHARPAELIRDAVDALPNGFLMVDSAGTIVIANPMIEQIFGYSERELRGQSVELLVPDAARALHRSERSRFVAQPQKRQMGAGRELFGRHKSGRDIPVEIGLAPFVSEEQRYVIATIVDITERIRAQEALRRSEEGLTAAQELAHLGSWERDPVTHTETWSRELYEIYGFDPRLGPPAIPSGLTPLIHPEDRERVLAGLDTFLSDGAAQRDVYRLLRPDGTVRWVDARRKRVVDADGRVRRIFGSVLDITERKRIEAALTATQQGLQALSRRLLQIHESERRELARELHDELGQTLTAVQITLKSIQRFPDDAPVSQRLEEATTIVDRALNQVRSLSLQLRPPLIDELGLIPAVRWLVERMAKSSGLQIQLRAGEVVARAAPSIEIAAFRIVQEALNNAIRHAHARTVDVEIVSDASALQLRITDDGVGFDVADAVARASGGSSLGLVGMEERARLAGGAIVWRSTPGSGTDVRARFPLISVPHDADEPPTAGI